MKQIFNAAVGIPAQARNIVERLDLTLTWSRHAMREAVRDRYGLLPKEAYPFKFKLSDGWELVEVESEGNVLVTKIVVRRPVDATRSLVLAILLESPKEGTVKTCWTNLNDDNHATLDTSKISTL